jgi:ankyrin repeat protein
LAKSDENPPALNDAIQRGHTQLALSLIEQVTDMSPSNGLLEKTNDNGETPLLVAAKHNHWKLIEIILTKRLDLAEQKDNDGNNLLHLLANLNDDQGVETIQNVLGILSNDMKARLTGEKNKNNQTPFDIAQSNGNTSSGDLLTVI